MPGVPSNKGCNACCRAKKKCDQIQPKCTRCLTRCIPCIGGGKQRYKFLQFTSSSFETAINDKLSLSRAHIPIVPRPLYLQTDPLVWDLADKLESVNSSFNLFWTYGGFLKHVPARLGASTLLDSAMTAFLAASDELGTQTPSKGFYKLYGTAIKNLRASLSGSDKVDPSFILCSIYLLWICQVWLGLAIPSHVACIVSILSSDPRALAPSDEFERTLLMSAGVTVIFERLWDPRIPPCPQLTKTLFGDEDPLPRSDGKDQNSRKLGIISPILRLPEFVKFDPSLVEEIRLEYDYMSNCTAATFAKLCDLGDPVKGPFHRPWVSPGRSGEHVRQWFKLHRFYTVELAIQKMLNAVLLAYEPDSVILREESAAIVRLVHTMVRAWPIDYAMGTEWIPFCMAMCWATSTSDSERASLDEVWRRCCASASQQSVRISAQKLSSVYRQLQCDATLHRTSHGLRADFFDKELGLAFLGELEGVPDVY